MINFESIKSDKKIRTIVIAIAAAVILLLAGLAVYGSGLGPVSYTHLIFPIKEGRIPTESGRQLFTLRKNTGTIFTRRRLLRCSTIFTEEPVKMFSTTTSDTWVLIRNI